MKAQAAVSRGSSTINVYVLAGILAIITLVQSTVVTKITIFGVSPDLVLLFVVATVLIGGAREGLLVSLIGGLVADILSGAPFGLTTICLVAVNYIVGMGEMNIFRTAGIWPYLAVIVATVAYNIMFLLLLQITGRNVLWGPMLWRVLAPSLVVNALFMPLMYILVRWLCSHMRPKPVEWE